MDTYDAKMELPFEQACWLLGTVVSATSSRAVADVGLKAMGMDHGSPLLTTLAPAHIDPTMTIDGDGRRYGYQRPDLGDAPTSKSSWQLVGLPEFRLCETLHS